MATSLVVVSTTPLAEAFSVTLRRTNAKLNFRKTGRIENTIYYTFEYNGNDGNEWKQWELLKTH